MTNDDRLKMLDLDGKEPASSGEKLPVTPGEKKPGPKLPASPTALHLDEWGLRRGRDLLKDSERMRACLASLGE